MDILDVHLIFITIYHNLLTHPLTIRHLYCNCHTVMNIFVYKDFLTLDYFLKLDSQERIYLGKK